MKANFWNLFKEKKFPPSLTGFFPDFDNMAFDLNKAGYDVAFISELDDETCADSLIMNDTIFKLADFKYCITTKSNTLAKELEHGFKQANTIK